MISAVIGCASPMVQAGLVATLRRAEIRAVACGAEPGAFRELCRRWSPRVVVADPETLGPSPETIAELTTAGTHVILFAEDASSAMLVQWLRVGARGCISARDTADAVIDAIELVLGGNLALESFTLDGGDLGAAAVTSSRGHLSTREREVLRLVADGRTNTEVARALFLEETTVKTHMTRIVHKLGAANRTAAVAIAVGRQMI